MTRLEDIARDKTVKSKYTALAEAAIEQLHRTLERWALYRKHLPEQPLLCYWCLIIGFNCMRKGADMLSIAQEDRYHSIFGATNVGNILAL